MNFALAFDVSFAVVAVSMYAVGAVTGDGDLSSLVQQFGPMAGLVVWLFWRDHKRERRLGARLDENERWLRTDYLAAMQEYQATAAKMAAAMDRMSRIGEKCDEYRGPLSSRPPKEE